MFLERRNMLACRDSIRLFDHLQELQPPCIENWTVQEIGGLTVIEPVPEAVEPILYKIFRRSKVEPGIDCHESALMSQNAIRICRELRGMSGGDEHSWMMLSNPVSHRCQLRGWGNCI